MGIVSDHPLRLARVRAGLSAEALAREVGVSRGAVVAVEAGRVLEPRDEFFQVLASRNGVEVSVLRRFFELWRRDYAGVPIDGVPASAEKVASLRARVLAQLDARGRAVLALSLYQVSKYGSFVAWRREVCGSAAKFASLLMVPLTSLRRFERQGGSMPPVLERALVRVLGLSEEYVAVLRALPDGALAVAKGEAAADG